MRFNKLDLNLLVALDALLTDRNISRAGERIHLSQPAMSNALARLRDYFGDDLLVSVGRKMELTPRAEVLKEAVRDVLVRIDTSVAAQPQFDCKNTDRVFKLFVSDYSMEVLMPHVLSIAQDLNSRARFQLCPQTAHPAKTLERGEADLLVIPSPYCSTEHPQQPLFEDEFVCVVWKGSSHARHGITAESYSQADHIVMRPSDQVEFAFGDRHIHGVIGETRRIQVSTYSFAALPFLVVGTELIATMHHLQAQLVGVNSAVSLIPLPIETPKLQQAMQWHKYRTQDPGLVWLRQLMNSAAARLKNEQL